MASRVGRSSLWTVAKKDKKKAEDAPPVDLAARIGSRSYEPPPPPPAPPDDSALSSRLDGPLPPRRDARPAMIGMDEPAPPPLRSATDAAASGEDAPKSDAIPSPRTLPGPGEIDLIVTPLPTPDDWHRFELALRRVPGIGHGIGQVKPEYYRQGVLKVRVTYVGERGLANALRAGVPGYRVRVIGEDRSTVQILVSGEGDERRPG
jgi:hypothetical protein